MRLDGFDTAPPKHGSEIFSEEDMDFGHHLTAHRFLELNWTAKLKQTLDKPGQSLYRD